MMCYCSLKYAKVSMLMKYVQLDTSDIVLFAQQPSEDSEISL